jgi:hypothetical protein
MPEKSQSVIGISTGIQLLLFGIGIPATVVPLVLD